MTEQMETERWPGWEGLCRNCGHVKRDHLAAVGRAVDSGRCRRKILDGFGTCSCLLFEQEDRLPALRDLGTLEEAAGWS